MKEGLAIARDVGGKRGMAMAIEELALVARAHARHVEAARLFAAAQTLREAIGAPLPPADHVRYDRAVAGVRAGLGEQAFAAAWAEGQAMALEQAVADALQVT